MILCFRIGLKDKVIRSVIICCSTVKEWVLLHFVKCHPHNHETADFYKYCTDQSETSPENF